MFDLQIKTTSIVCIFLSSLTCLTCTFQLSLAFPNPLPPFGFIDWLELPKIMAEKSTYLIHFDEILFSCLFYIKYKKIPSLSLPPHSFFGIRTERQKK